jgi:hypothetical protein
LFDIKQFERDTAELNTEEERPLLINAIKELIQERDELRERLERLA